MFPYPVSFLSSGAFSSTKSLDFDGMDDYVDCGDSDDFSFTDGAGTDTAFSISMWVYPTSNTGFPGFFDKTTGSGIEYGAYHWSTGMDFVLFDGNTSNRIARRYGSALALNTWQHLCFTYDGTESSSGMKIYLDGSVLTTGTNDAGVYAGMTNTDSPFIIGKYFSTNEFIGNIDEVAVWKNKELSAGEVSDIFNGGVPTDLTSLSPISWYRMGENSTFSSPQILMPENTNKDKVSNYSMAFDGVDDSVNCGDFSAYDNGDLSCSFWMYKTGSINAHIISNSGSSSRAGFDIKIDSTERLYLRCNTRTTTLQSGWKNTTITDDTWFHIAITFDEAANEGKIYVNGVLISTIVGYSRTNSASIDLAIGSYSGGASAFFTGKIDEVSIFNEVKAIGDLWDGTGQPTDLSGESGLVGYWKMGEDATFVYNVNPDGTWTIPDQAGSNDGTSNNLMADSARVGTAPNSSNNAVSFNMDAADIKTEAP